MQTIFFLANWKFWKSITKLSTVQTGVVCWCLWAQKGLRFKIKKNQRSRMMMRMTMMVRKCKSFKLSSSGRLEFECVCVCFACLLLSKKQAKSLKLKRRAVCDANSLAVRQCICWTHTHTACRLSLTFLQANCTRVSLEEFIIFLLCFSRGESGQQQQKTMMLSLSKLTHNKSFAAVFL